MKLKYLATASAAVALLGGAAFAQQSTEPSSNNAPVTASGAPQPGSVTGDWNGAHAPPDDKQYSDTVRVPLGTAATPDAATPPSASASVNPAPTADQTAAAPAATQYAQQTATFSNLTVTNGPVPDTPENRAKYGGPDSRAGKRTQPAGN